MGKHIRVPAHERNHIHAEYVVQKFCGARIEFVDNRIHAPVHKLHHAHVEIVVRKLVVVPQVPDIDKVVDVPTTKQRQVSVIQLFTGLLKSRRSNTWTIASMSQCTSASTTTSTSRMSA